MRRFFLLSIAAFLSAAPFALGQNATRPVPPKQSSFTVPPQNFVLVAKSAEIAPGTVSGWNWDFFLFAYPEPFVKVHVFQADGLQVDYGESGYQCSTCAPAWNRELATVAPGDRIRIEVWDKDFRYDDLIGKCDFVLTPELIRQGALALQFGQVRRLELEVRPLR